MSTSASASMSTSRSSMESHLIKLRFNPAGQPIGPTATTFSTNIGQIVKTHVPPTYNSWKKVPQHLKEDTLFDVPECHRPCVLTRANATWRDWKCDLRSKVYDKYNTDVERKRALLQYLKREDWETFVDSEGSLQAQSRRRVGKAARASLKSPHTSGRKGQARVADELQQHPEREVTRCEIFIKTHYKKDGTASRHHVERLSGMCDDDPSSAHNDIDNDGVAKVFGTDTCGRVRGLGWVSQGQSCLIQILIGELIKKCTNRMWPLRLRWMG